MARGRKRKVIIPESVSQHIEEEFKKDRDFRKVYIDEITNLNLAYKIVQLRKARHLSQKELAKKMHTSQQTISRLESPDNKEVSVSTLSKIAVALRARVAIDFKLEKLKV